MDKPKILAVEADSEVAALYHQYFSKHGYEIRAVPGPSSAALELGGEINLIIVGDFVASREWLNQVCHNPKTATIPIVVASGRGDILQVSKGNNGLSALTKPFHMEELEELVQVLLSKDWKDEASMDKRTH